MSQGTKKIFGSIRDMWFVTCGNYGGQIRQNAWKKTWKNKWSEFFRKIGMFRYERMLLVWSEHKLSFGLKKKKKPNQYNGMRCFSINTFVIFHCVSLFHYEICEFNMNNWTQSNLFRFVCMVGVWRLGGVGWVFSHFVHQTRNPISCTVLILESCSGLGDITSPSLLLLLS